MAITEIPARGFKFELNTGTNGSPNWVPIAGIDTFSHTPTTNRADTRHFEDGGRLRHWVASRGDQFTLSGKRQEDPDTGDRDPGQEAVEAWAQEVGPGSIKQFRITSPGGNVLTFEASAEVTLFGGGNDDPASWQVVIEVSGPISAA
ncbi:MAG TPA: hypothetical protein VKZ72_00310 [Acidimicrobiales bacterium]|nr:hypothetical protein [Acidimicrobiales bacterium]